MANTTKRVRWVGSSKKDLQSLPKAVRQNVGKALWDAQEGEVPPGTKILHGFGGGSVLEIRADHDGNAYRAAYTIRLGEFVYVLHVFQKKSKKGSKTPAGVMELIRKRLRIAEEHYEQWKGTEGNPA